MIHDEIRGGYYFSKFLVEFEQATAGPGDFQRYMLSDFRELLGQAPPETWESVGSSIYTVFHEATHLIHDFTLGSELLRDVLEDHICGEIKAYIEAAYEPGFPLLLPLNQYGFYAKDNLVKKLQETQKAIYTHKILTGMRGKNMASINTEDLLESLVAVHTCNCIFCSLPESDRGSFAYARFDMEKMSGKYASLWSLYKTALGSNLNYGRLFVTTSFLLLCDIALHIPCFIPDEEEGDSNFEVPEACLPPMRFVRALETLKENAGFPDAVEGTDFYITLYDFFAKRNGWPLFQQTYESWHGFLRHRTKQGFMVSDGYRLLAAAFKGSLPTQMITRLPGELLYRMGVPVLIKYNGQSGGAVLEYAFSFLAAHAFETFSVLETSSGSPLQDPYIIMKDFRNTWSLESFEQAIQTEMDRSWNYQASFTFLREILCRIIAKEFFKAVESKSCFSCPMAGLHCQSKRVSCRSLKKLTNLPLRCCLELWLRESGIRKDSICWER